MVGSYEERELGKRIVLREFFDKYRLIVDIHSKYIEEHRKEWNKDHFNTNKLYKITKELKKISTIKEKLEKEWINSL